MQMSALLVAILLAGGNPVWDRANPATSLENCHKRAAEMAVRTADPAINAARMRRVCQQVAKGEIRS